MHLFHRRQPPPDAISPPAAYSTQSSSVSSVQNSEDSWNDVPEVPGLPAPVAPAHVAHRRTGINATLAKVFHTRRTSHRSPRASAERKANLRNATVVPNKPPDKNFADHPLNNGETQSKSVSGHCGLLTIRRRMWNRSNGDVTAGDVKDRKVHPVTVQPGLHADITLIPASLDSEKDGTTTAQKPRTLTQACPPPPSNETNQKLPVSHSHRIALHCPGTTADQYSGAFPTFKHIRTSTQPMQQSHNMSKSLSDTALVRKYGALQGIIGKGSCGTVHLAQKSDPKGKCKLLFAIKKFHQPHSFETEKQYVKRLTNAFQISSTLHHVNIVKTIDLVQDKAMGWFEVMEYCPGGDLYALLHDGALVPSEADCYFRQLVNGIAYLHSMGIAHRDIKPEKLLLDASGCIKITDFGNSEVFRPVWGKNMHSLGGLSGNMEYVSPEELLEETFDPRCADVWASGIVYIAMIYARIPWKSATIDDVSYSRYRTYHAHQQRAPSPLTRTAENRNSVLSPHNNSKRPQTPLRSNSTPTGRTDCGPGYAMIASLPPTPRYLLFRILDPDPKTRVTIEDALCSQWVLGIETCHPSEVPANYAESVRRAREALTKNETENVSQTSEGKEGTPPVVPIPDGFADRPELVPHTPKREEHPLKNEVKDFINEARGGTVSVLKTSGVSITDRFVHREPEEYAKSEKMNAERIIT